MAKDNQDKQKTNLFRLLFICFKRHKTEILLLINVVGFVNLFLYYKSFNIPIFNYVGINDLIFYVLEYVLSLALVLAFVICLCKLVFSIIKFPYLIFSCVKEKWSRYITKTSKEDESKAIVEENSTIRKVILYAKIAIVAIVPVLMLNPLFKLFIIPASILYGLYLYASDSKEGVNTIFFMISSVLIVSCFTGSTINSIIEKRVAKQDYTISFIDNNQQITTEKGHSSLNYLGESSKAIFLYDIESKEARIYIKSNISDIRTQPNAAVESVLGFFADMIFFTPCKKGV